MSLRQVWLIFAQAITVALAVYFVMTTLHPEWFSLYDQSPNAGYKVPQGEPPRPQAAALTYRDAVQKALPAVVNVYASKRARGPRNPLLDDPLFRQFFGDRSDESQQKSQGLGSGVIFDPKGYVLTNQHVVDAADEIEIALSDGRRLKARTVGSDPDSDLAVLQVEATSLPAITFGDDLALRPGDVVLAIGNPFGIGQTVTMGIVSGLSRTPGINTFESFIQTDAAINPGNSGGALVDTVGNLVGINTAIFSRTGGSLGIGYAIPVSLAKRVLESIVATGGVTRGWIGVEVAPVTEELADSFRLGSTKGAIVAGVVRGGPADKAGLRPGDILQTIGESAVKDHQSVLNLVAALPPGKPSVIRIFRDRKELSMEITIGTRPKPTARH